MRFNYYFFLIILILVASKMDLFKLIQKYVPSNNKDLIFGAQVIILVISADILSKLFSGIFPLIEGHTNHNPMDVYHFPGQAQHDNYHYCQPDDIVEKGKDQAHLRVERCHSPEDYCYTTGQYAGESKGRGGRSSTPPWDRIIPVDGSGKAGVDEVCQRRYGRGSGSGAAGMYGGFGGGGGYCPDHCKTYGKTYPGCEYADCEDCPEYCKAMGGDVSKIFGCEKCSASEESGGHH